MKLFNFKLKDVVEIYNDEMDLMPAEEAKKLSVERKAELESNYKPVTRKEVFREIDDAINSGNDFVVFYKRTIKDDLRDELVEHGYDVSYGFKDRDKLFIHW